MALGLEYWDQYGCSYEGPVNVYIKDGGATFDTSGYNMNIDVPLQHGGVNSIDGGITKKGAGTLLLSGGVGSGANTYTGVTTVAAGVPHAEGNSIATPIAWNPVLNLGGANVQGGKLAFDYTGGTDPERDSARRSIR